MHEVDVIHVDCWEGKVMLDVFFDSQGVIHPKLIMEKPNIKTMYRKILCCLWEVTDNNSTTFQNLETGCTTMPTYQLVSLFGTGLSHQDGITVLQQLPYSQEQKQFQVSRRCKRSYDRGST